MTSGLPRNVGWYFFCFYGANFQLDWWEITYHKHVINQFHNKQNILPTYFYVFFILLNEMFLYGNFFIKLTIFHLSKTKSENGEYYRKNEILVSELAHSAGQSPSRINTSLTQILYGSLQKKSYLTKKYSLRKVSKRQQLSFSLPTRLQVS